ncbi:substrate-binding periplasmic protein [Thalassomonas haliotis]|uniref:Transporter substrate-binding domain-containing protein n=1 Tax=Thalassomonas haliotis TaxID=485448 RepID=A0ABY7VKA9_9GAMM|nr:transporter substrate-binding domain-containing protein [Thalassomonas haliotis]WDE14180.1 transporter substrate-binding domain-containing protein [Thalassomonas haliotis]
MAVFFSLPAPAHGTAGDNKQQSGEQRKSSLVIVTGQFPPFIDENRRDKGYVSRLVTDIFAQVGIKTEFLFVPWGRALRMVELGREAAVMYFDKSEQRAESFTFSDPMLWDNWVLFHLKKKAISWRRLEDLSVYKIGATISYTYTPDFYRLADENVLSVSWQPYDKQGWKMLMAERLDIFANTESAWYYAQQEFSPQNLARLTIHPKPLAAQLGHVLFSKAHPDGDFLREQFNLGFSKLKKLRTLADYFPDKVAVPWPDISASSKNKP